MSVSSQATRRKFLAGVSVAGASLHMPSLLLADKAKPAKMVVLGSGEDRYECQHYWGSIPQGTKDFGNATHGVAVDREGLIYISHMGPEASVFVYDAKGKLLRKMLKEHAPSGHGLDIRAESGGQEYLYLSPANPKMAFAKATLDGKIVWSIGKEKLEKDSGLKLERYRPTNMSFGPDGSVYLGDGYGSQYIFRYSSEGKFMSYFGGKGEGDAQFSTPHGQWLDDRDGRPKVAVCDRAHALLKWFDLEGNYLAMQSGFLFPADIDIQWDKMVVPDLHARVTLLGKDNKVIAHLGEDAKWREEVLGNKFAMRKKGPKDWPAGKFIHPHDACFDHEGNLFVVEWVVGGRITKLKKVS